MREKVIESNQAISLGPLPQGESLTNPDGILKTGLEEARLSTQEYR